MSRYAIDWSELSLQVMLTFAHFLWQACVVGFVLLVVQLVGESLRDSRILRNRRASKKSVSIAETELRGANVRYTIACVAFFSLPICVAATFAWVHQARGPIVLVAIDSIESPSYPVATATEAIPIIVNDDAPVLSPPEMTMSADVTVSELIAPASIVTPRTSPSERIQATAPYLLLTYSIGVAFMLARFCLSIIGSSQLRRTIEPITDAKLLKTIKEHCARLGLKRIPVVAICQRVSVPVVVGIVKPMILLPPTLLCGLDPNQLAAILNHELAHIRRYDLIVNLLQRVVEALLFFHPVTWWISRSVSIERENCCDDVAADCMGRLPYAGALLQMAELCVGNDRRRMASLASLSADGGSTSDFGYRVRRLIGAEETTRIGLTRRGFSIGLALVSLVAVSLVAWGQNQESEDERSEEGKMSKIFTPEPQWQTKLAADDAASEMSRISPIVVATDHVLSVSNDFDLRTGRQFDKPFPRLPRTSEFEVALNPMLRRTSSDRAFIIEAANRTPGNTWSGPSYDLRVLRATDGSQLGVTITLPGFFDGSSCDVDVENGGDFLLLGMGNEVHVYRTETGQIETTMPVKTKRTDAVAISPDREWLVVSDQNDLHFWRWRDQAPVKTIHVGRKIDSLVFTPDGQYLAEGPDSREDIQIRDMRTLEIIASLKDEVGSPLMVSSMDITPDGRYLVAHNEVSVDQTKLTIPHRIHVWDLQSRGKPVFQIATGEWVRKVAFSDDGRMIVGEFSGAAHGNLLAAWQLRNEVLEREANAPRDAIDRLGDGIQWSRSGDRDGLLSGARLILPDAGLKSGEPLVVEYRLANVSTETKTLTCYLNNGMQFTSLGHGNRISGFGFDRHREPVTLTIKPGAVFIDTEHLVSIDTTGLEPGKYQAALGSAFFYPDSVEPNTTYEIPHRGSIPFTIVGESTVKTVELPKGDIHWGKPIAGLQLGARFTGDATQFVIGSTIEADLYVANVTDQPIECSVVLPHPIDGWLFNVEDSTGSTIMLERQAPKRIFRPQRYVNLRIAPGEIASLTGENVQASYSSDSTDDAFATTLPKAKFQVIETKEDAEQARQDRTDNIQGRLISQGGEYSAIFDVTLLRPEIPALRLDLDSGNVRFTILGPNMTPVALQQSDSSNSQLQTAQVANEPQWGEASDGLRCRIVPVSPTMDAEKVNLSFPQDRFQSPEEITFAVEIENVSDNPISIRDIRYGEGYAEETRAKTNANHFAPHLFEFTFTDLAGNAISRTQREFVLDSHAFIVHGASITQLEPKQSIKCLLTPAMFQRSMEYRLAPGQYQVQVRYRGLNQATKDWIASKMQPKQPDNTWSHQVASNVAKFSISDNEFREPDLVWGPTIDGLQAALEIRVPRGSGIPTQAPDVPPTTTLTPILHVKNVSDKPVTFVSETGRQGDQLQIKTADGKDIEVKDAFYTGWPIDVRWTLQPGDVAELDVLTPSLNQNLAPGEYTARYTIRFNSRQSKDEAGNQTFPAPGDYDSVIDTGWTPLFIRDPSQTIAETISRKTDAASSAEQQSQAADASERDILWGASLDGMRLGIRLSEFAKRKSPLRHGDHIKYEVWIKNETDEVVQIDRDPRDLFSPKLMEDQSINVVGCSMFLSFGVPQEELIKAELILAPGQASRRFVGQYHSASIRKPGSPRGRFGLEPLLIEPGKYPVYAQLGKLTSGIDEIEILPAPRLQIRKANQVTDERREYVAQDPSEEIVTWQGSDGTKQEAAINWDGGVLVDEGDLAAVEVVAVDGQPDQYSILLQLRPESAAWFARQTKSLAEMQEPNLLAVLLDGKPLMAPRLNSEIPDGKIMISGRFTKADADGIASKLRSLKNANWITAPQVCVGKAYSDTAKAANWKWDEEQRVSLATPESGEMLASRLPGANADFVVQIKLKLNDGAQCRLTVGDATFELSNSTEQTQLVIAGEEYAFKNDNQSLDWTMVSVKRLDNKLSVEVNGKPEISRGANAKAIDKISLQSTRGTIAVSNFVVTGDVQPSKVQVQGASNSTGLQGREDASKKSDVEETTIVAALPNSYEVKFDVVDDSGQAIDNVAILYKEDEATWYEGEESDYATGAAWLPFRIVEHGKSTFQADTPAIMGNAHVLIAAKGFEPITLKLNEQLERGQPIVKQVRMIATQPVEFILTTGTDQPAADATFETLKSKELRAAIAHSGGAQLDQFLKLNVSSDAQGIVRFPRPAFSNWTTYRIEHPAGYVDVRGKDLPMTEIAQSAARKIQLSSYATINGSYQPQIKANEFLEMYRMKSNRQTVDSPAQLITLDKDGRFVAAKLMAGWYTFVHRVRYPDNGSTAIAIYGPFALKEGESRDFVLGADGRSLVGRFVLPDSDELRDRTLSVSVSSGTWPGYPVPPQELDGDATLAWWNEYWESDQGKQFRDYNRRSFRASIADDGSFHFPSLPPGDYTLSLDVLQPVGAQTQLVQTKLKIPDDKKSEPIELGELPTNVEPQKQQAAVQPDTANRTKVNLGQLRQNILGQWDVSPIPGIAGVAPNAESMTLKFSELDKYESYVQKQDYVEFASGSWKLAGDQISVKFKSVTMQPTDNTETEAVFQVVAPEALVWNGIHFHKRTAATPIILAANHPLHAVAGELLSNLNSNSPNEAWRIVEISDKPPVKSPQILNSFDPSKAKGYRLLLTRDYRESANTMQQIAILPTEQESRLRTEQMEIVLLTIQPTKAPAELKSRIEWLPSLSRSPTQDICLGDGVGYTWFVRAPLHVCHLLKDQLRLVGGDDMLVTLVQSLISTKNMPPRSDANTAASMLTTYGDRAVVAVEQAVLKKKPADEYWHLIGSLAEIRTDASTKLLIRLYQSEDTDLRRAAAYALVHKPFRREAAQVYLDLLKNRMSVEAASAACIELGLTEALPILEELFTNVNKPSSLRELDTIFAARRTLQGNPIPKTLIDASEIIYQSRASDPTDDGSVIGNAIKQLTESGDHEAVIMLALQMTNYVAKGSDDRIRAFGTAILKSQKRAEAVLFLTQVLDSLQPREREQILKTINPLAPPATTSSLTPQPNPPQPNPPQPNPPQPNPPQPNPQQPNSQQPNPYSTSSAAATPVPTGSRKLAATIFGTTVYRDQLGSESAKAELSKLPQDQAAAKRLEIEGEALLSWISRRAIEDYVRREKIEITPEMSAQLIEVVNATELTPNPNSTMSEEQRRGGLQFMMRGSLMDWLVCKSLYERYGGRVGMGSLGLWIAVDGRNELMREYIKKGSIVINDAELEKAFWKAANKPNFADAYPTGDQLKHLMSAPPFLREQKKKSASVE